MRTFIVVIIFILFSCRQSEFKNFEQPTESKSNLIGIVHDKLGNIWLGYQLKEDTLAFCDFTADINTNSFTFQKTPLNAPSMDSIRDYLHKLTPYVRGSHLQKSNFSLTLFLNDSIIYSDSYTTKNLLNSDSIALSLHNKILQIREDNSYRWFPMTDNELSFYNRLFNELANSDKKLNL